MDKVGGLNFDGIQIERNWTKGNIRSVKIFLLVRFGKRIELGSPDLLAVP
jgi:hypothetical protein